MVNASSTARNSTAGRRSIGPNRFALGGADAFLSRTVNTWCRLRGTPFLEFATAATDYEYIGALETARVAYGMGVEQFADIHGLHRSTYWRARAGETAIGMQHVALAACLSSAALPDPARLRAALVEAFAASGAAVLSSGALGKVRSRRIGGWNVGFETGRERARDDQGPVAAGVDAVNVDLGQIAFPDEPWTDADTAAENNLLERAEPVLADWLQQVRAASPLLGSRGQVPMTVEVGMARRSERADPLAEVTVVLDEAFSDVFGYLPWNWCRSVLERDWAVLDGHFVVRILDSSGGRPSVVAALRSFREGEGHTHLLLTARASVEWDADGTAHVSWSPRRGPSPLQSLD